jgi:hypothetical protein
LSYFSNELVESKSRGLPESLGGSSSPNFLKPIPSYEQKELDLDKGLKGVWVVRARL